MKYLEVKRDLESIKNLKTKDVDLYDKKLIKEKVDVSDLKEYAIKDQLVHRTYFQVSLAELKTYEEKFEFIEDNFDLLQDWWHVDQLMQFLRNKPIDFNYAYAKAKEYIKNDNPFVRRWGYVLFLMDFQKNPEYAPYILKLFKDDDAYYVEMGEAWLLADMAIFSFDQVYDFLLSSGLKYDILGKAIQKMCDSFRISDEHKEQVKAIRDKIRDN